MNGCEKLTCSNAGGGKYFQCGENAVNKSGSEDQALLGTCADSELCCECPEGTLPINSDISLGCIQLVEDPECAATCVTRIDLRCSFL